MDRACARLYLLMLAAWLPAQEPAADPPPAADARDDAARGWRPMWR